MSHEEIQEDTLKAINLKTLLSLLTLFGIFAASAGAWFVQAHRVSQLEIDSKLCKEALSKPRYALEDDERRMDAFTLSLSKEMDRRANWMESHDLFRLETVKATTDMSANLREIKNLLIQMRSDIDKSPKAN